MCKKILLIDDDESCNYLHKLRIEREKLNAEVTVFQDAINALSYIKDIHINNIYNEIVIFLDLNMPIMDGWRFIEEFGKIDNHHKIKIYILSNSKNPDDLQKAQEFNFVKKFYNKPLTKEILMEVFS